MSISLKKTETTGHSTAASGYSLETSRDALETSGCSPKRGEKEIADMLESAKRSGSLDKFVNQSEYAEQTQSRITIADDTGEAADQTDTPVKRKKVVSIYNIKGGVGKSTIARELAYKLNAVLVDCDKGGAQEYIASIKTVSVKDSTPPRPETIDGEIVIYDFAGKFDTTLESKNILARSDLIIVPYTPSLYALQNTVESFLMIYEGSRNVMMIANMLKDEKDLDRTKEEIEEALNQLNPEIGEVLIKPLHFTRGLQSAENDGKSIYQLRERSAIDRLNYSKICGALDQIADAVTEVIR